MSDPAVKEIKIDRLAFGGDGVGKLDGKVCFVPGAAPGETLGIKVVDERKTFCRGLLETIIQPAAARIAPRCPLAGHGCPGCVYQHLRYEEEVRIKQNQLKELLQRLAGINPAGLVLAPIPSPCDYGYRNKLTLHAQPDENGMKLGYFMADNRTVIDLPDCPLAAPEINQLLETERNRQSFRDGLTDGMNVTFRWTKAEQALCWRNRPAASQSCLHEETPCGEMLVPAGSFFQVNRAASGELMKLVSALLTSLTPSCFVDLYCGVGFFSRAAVAAGVKQIIGIESDPEAVKTANRNLKAFPDCHGRFITGKVEKTLAILSQQTLPASTVLLVDPPRSGLDADALRRMALLKISHLIYVSCSPDTLCRDLKALTVAGYQLKSAQIVDMFPRTAHFETVTWLSRNG